MVLTKREIIPPTRRRISDLSELIDNNRQIRAREFERNRRKITQYELLQDVQKPIINVIKGLFEDANSWDIKKLEDGRVSWAKLKWTNISPLLQQLNRMSRTEAVETLSETKNKIPNAYTQQIDIIDRLARVFAEKPARSGKVTINDLDKVGILAPITNFYTPDSTPRGSPLRPPDYAGAAAAAPPPANSGIDISERQRMGEPPPPLPDYTPAVPGPDAIKEGLDIEGYASRFGATPEVLKYAADLLDEGPEKSKFILRKAEELAASGEEIRPSTRELAIVEEMANVISNLSSRNPEVRNSAERKLHYYKEAVEVAASVNKHPEIKERFIDRFASLGSPRRSRISDTGDPVPYPYRVNPRQALRSLIEPVAEGIQPFRAGMPVVSGESRTGEQRPPVTPIGTEGSITSEEITQYISDIRMDDRVIVEADTPTLTEVNDAHIVQLGQQSYQTGANPLAPSTTIVRTPMNKINIMGKQLDIHDIKPMTVKVGRKTLSFSPNAWKVLTLKDPNNIQYLDLSSADDEHLKKVADALDYKDWKPGNPKFNAVSANIRAGRDPPAASEPLYDPRDTEEELDMTRRSLSRGRVPSGRTRGPRLPAEGEDDLFDTLPQQWSQTGFAQGYGNPKGKKWNPLKLDERGGLGEISVSLPDLLERMELVVKRKVGGKVMMRKKGVPIDLIRLLTRRFNPSVKYSDESKDLYRKVIGLSKVPLGNSYSQKETVLGSGVKIQQPTFQKAIADAEPDRVMDKMLTDLGSFRNGNRSKMLINELSSEADFLLEKDLIGEEEHELIHKLIMNKSKKLSPELKVFLDDLFTV
jgi:hypothetical protein